MRRALVLVLLLGLLGAPVAAQADEKRPGKRGKAREQQSTSDDKLPRHEPAWTPPDGVLLSDPTTSDGRIVVHRVLRAVRETRKGELIQIATFNFADHAAADALIRAVRRGVRVQVIANHRVEHESWTTLKRFLARDRKDRSWAKTCEHACRSTGPAMHMKFALFSAVNTKKHVTMVGSANITSLAGRRQWNDLVTQSGARLWKTLHTVFGELRRDRNVGGHPSIYRAGRHEFQAWPSYQHNLIAQHLGPVRCLVGKRRTVVRIAVAGWFGAYGNDIAEIVRQKWEEGCDVKVLGTLLGASVENILTAHEGRGPIPTRMLVECCDSGVPSKYVHLKAIAIKGAYGADDEAAVLLTGSPNWTRPASRTDEHVLRVRNAGRMVDSYIRHLDEWYVDAQVFARVVPDFLMPRPRALRGRDVPKWFELN